MFRKRFLIQNAVSDVRYTLLVGKPPFETTCLKETYVRIKKNDYTIPRVSEIRSYLFQFKAFQKRFPPAVYL